MPSKPKPCFIPDNAETNGFNTRVIKKPGVLPAGIATTGPLARSLFIFGYTEEQALVAGIKGKGLVIFTGCGHPTIELIVKMGVVYPMNPSMQLAADFISLFLMEEEIVPVFGSRPYSGQENPSGSGLPMKILVERSLLLIVSLRKKCFFQDTTPATMP